MNSHNRIWPVVVTGLLVLGLAGSGFLLIAARVGAEGTLVRFDIDVTQRLHTHAHDHPLVARVFLIITELGSTWFLTVFTAGVAVVLVLRRRWVMAVVWVVVVGGGALVNVGIKHIYLRERPHFPEELRLVIEQSPSFTSGHSAGSMVCYGMLAYLLLHVTRRRWARVGVVVGLGLLILAIGFSRMYLGAHWFSDVIGGFCVGIAWLAIWITGIEILRRRTAYRE